MEHGAVATGIALAGTVSTQAMEQFRTWISTGNHAGMAYMERYEDIRNNPELLLEGAKSIAVAAFGYKTFKELPPDAPAIARYALGEDYHTVIRKRLEHCVKELKNSLGGEWRICIDTAPLRERYWGVEAGVGFIGLNNQLIVPGAGSMVFLGSLITTLELEPSGRNEQKCLECGRCIAACPAKALCTEGVAVDARKCISYLTIEHRGDFADATQLHGWQYGCDVCQKVCPYNADVAPQALPEFEPSDSLMLLTNDLSAKITREEFNGYFRHSAIKRTKYEGWIRNALHNKKTAPKTKDKF